MKRFVVATLVVIAVVAVLAFRLLGNQHARLLLDNQSGATIEDLTVEVAGQKFALGALPSQRNTAVRIDRYSDSDWFISGRWPDGATFHEHIGYITHGMSFDDRVVFDSARKLKYTSVPK